MDKEQNDQASNSNGSFSKYRHAPEG